MARTAAQRKEAQRARERRGEILVRVAVTNEAIGMLMDLGWLLENESECSQQIGAAVAALIADLTSDHERKIVTS
ncbi:hypothetical protein ACVIHI_002668 [Bradyrhizobium sp. USDA 4524]|uniref:hypothetical protein n=1 Tax=unclassified Bradyrhizobium TaxID=2631580 RepID=UPI00209EAA02|nr:MULTISPECIES: hypothetical protein [unclassified Bradyrhizobium]MCP1844411.1 hypothetical protein [Bradyrhizobium sp. USDA 4538]MCP1904977.1 hypothetical protein [Bradyrhizobium sp. USDA 4537]MCP1989367.1 hypothetical protein [Bradyrhizobium sp. USDA 4539]